MSALYTLYDSALRLFSPVKKSASSSATVLVGDCLMIVISVEFLAKRLIITAPAAQSAILLSGSVAPEAWLLDAHRASLVCAPMGDGDQSQLESCFKPSSDRCIASFTCRC